MNPLPNLPEVFGANGHRRMVRVSRTQELAIRLRHRRRASVIRGGVLVLFGFAMVIYPIFGTLSPAARAADRVPGLVEGIIPQTIEVALGQTKGLTEGVLPPPNLDDTAHFLATSSTYVVSQYLTTCNGVATTTGPNGGIPDDSLCVLWDGQNRVRSDAAITLAQLNHAFNLKFGRNLCIISSYRSIDDQWRVKRLKGHLAAAPGQSYHGWGLAVDVCTGDDRGEHFQWLKENAPAYGWDNPLWASTQMYEPWHWEYMPGTSAVGWESEPGSYSSGLLAEIDIVPSPEPSSTPAPVVSPDPTPAPEPTP